MALREYLLKVGGVDHVLQIDDRESPPPGSVPYKRPVGKQRVPQNKMRVPQNKAARNREPKTKASRKKVSRGTAGDSE